MRIEEDKFNTDIFKIKMGNIVECKEEWTPDSITNLISDGKKSGFSHLTVKIETKDKQLVEQFLMNDFVVADTLMEFVYDMKKTKLVEIEHKCIIRDCLEEDLNALKEIAHESFKIDRFHSDSSLDNELCDNYYEKWIENSFNGFADKVIVAEYKNEAIGFTTGKIREGEKYGHLVLSAVSNKYRGLGVYTSMIHEGVRWIIENYPNLDGIIVGTQIENIPVQKAWIKLGFTVYNSTYVLQKKIGE